MKRLATIALCSALALSGLGIAAAPPASAAGTGTTEWVSPDPQGLPTGKSFGNPAVSGDGRWVAFETEAKLVPQDTNNTTDVYRRRRQTGDVVLVSVNQLGFSGTGPSRNASISADGSHVAFESDAHDLAAISDFNQKTDVFVRDLDNQTTDLVSAAQGNITSGNQLSRRPAISGNGLYVAFESVATDLVPNAAAGFKVFRRALHEAKTVLVSTPGPGGTGTTGDQATINYDGTVVAFASADQLTTDDDNLWMEVYVRDLRTTPATHRALASSLQPNAAAYQPAISGDGLTVAFTSAATTISDKEKDAKTDVFIAAWQEHLLTIVSRGTFNMPGDGASHSPVLGQTTSEVAFVTSNTNMGLNDANGSVEDVVVRTWGSGAALVSTYQDNQSSLPARTPAISSDGRYVAFAASFISPLTVDIFLRTPPTPQVTKVTPATVKPGQVVTLTVNGYGFVHTPTVGTMAGITVQNVVWNSAQELQIGIKVAFNASQGARTLVITNPDQVQAWCVNCLTVSGLGIQDSPPADPPPADPAPVPPPAPGDNHGDGPGPDVSGYWLLGRPGNVFAFGGVAHHGQPAAEAALDIEPTPSGNGYWILQADGTVTAHGDAAHFGHRPLPPCATVSCEQTTAISATPSGHGYWLFTNHGRVFTFGDAVHHGDIGVVLNGPILDAIAVPDGLGYYMVASDGGVFAFGSAKFLGSMGSTRLNAPVQSLVPDPDGVGYWLVASDGGVFAFAADFRGSMGGKALNKPMTGMVPYGNGYVMVAEDGGVFNFSGLDTFFGSLGGNPPPYPIVSVAAVS